MRFVGRGHPAIRATHANTLELCADAEITARATCVIAVGAEAEPSAPFAGPIRIRIAAGAERFSFDAIANPSWAPGGPAVVRVGPARLPGTFATHADAGAADLPRALVATLTDPDQLVTVDVVARPTDVSTLVLFAALGPSSALDAELAAADLVLALDDDARTFIGRHEARRGPRTLVVATRDLPWREGRDADRVETVGLPARLAVVAAQTRAPLVLVPDGVDPREVIRRAPANHLLGFTAVPRELPDLLALADEIRGPASATFAREHEPPVFELGGFVGDAPIACCLAAGETSLDPVVGAAMDGLLADGVPTKVAARALATLTGWPQRRAYDEILARRPTP